MPAAMLTQAAYPARLRSPAGIVAAALTALLALPVSAQTAQEDSVTARPRPEYEAIGLSPAVLFGYADDKALLRGPLGLLDAFQIFPSLGLELFSTDNVFKTPDGKVFDQVVRLQPTVELRSDWDNHALNLGFHADSLRHFDRKSEDTDDWGAFVDGRLDLSDRESIDLRASHDLQHEERGSVDDVNGSEPTLFTVDAAQLDWRYQRAAVLTRFLFNSRHLRFLDTPSTLGVINQSDRNRWEYDPRLRVGYEAFAGTVLYVEPTLSWRRYDREFDRNNEQRDSDGRELLVGLTYDASAVSYLDIGVGYTRRDYKDPDLPSISGFASRAALTWNPLDQITINSSLSRSIREATQQGVAGFFVTAASVSLDYELRYDVILQSDARYSLEQAKARSGFSETDKIYGVGLGATFMVNEYMRTRAGYRFERRDSDVVGLDYSENRFFVRLELQY